MRIDAHQHFWVFDPVRDSWIDDSMRVIRRDFLPEDLKPVLATYHFEGCIAVQADQSEKENDFLLGLVQKHDFIKGIVGWVDLQAKNIEERLQYYQSQKLIKGFRHILQGEAQRDFMLQPAFKYGLSLLERFNFTYDILILPDQMQYVEELIRGLPHQKFVIDHIAKPDIKNQNIADWKKEMQFIAKYENVSCKVSGMLTEADWHHWKINDFDPYLEVVFETFGTKRLMYGSDWPVCNVAGSYENTLDIIAPFIQKLSPQEQAQFYGLNATAFYQL